MEFTSLRIDCIPQAADCMSTRLTEAWKRYLGGGGHSTGEQSDQGALAQLRVCAEDTIFQDCMEAVSQELEAEPDLAELVGVHAIHADPEHEQGQVNQLSLCLLLELVCRLPGVVPGHTMLTVAVPVMGISQAFLDALNVLTRALRSQEWCGGLKLIINWSQVECTALVDLLRSPECKLHSLHLEGIWDRPWLRSLLLALQESTSTLVHLSLAGGLVTDEFAEHLAQLILHNNGTLQQLTLAKCDLTADGLGPLCEALSTLDQDQQGLRCLDISGNKRVGESTSQGCDHLGKMVARNRSLRSLIVAQCGLAHPAHLISVLCNNTSVEELHIGGNKLAYMADLFSDCLAVHNKGVKRLVMTYSFGDDDDCLAPAEAVSVMLSCNKTLLEVDMGDSGADSEFAIVCGTPYAGDEWAELILPALHKNTTLESMLMRGCSGLDGDEVRTALLDLLQHNTSLKVMDMRDTPLFDAGELGAVEEELRNRNKDSVY